MRKYVILAQSEATAQALSIWRELISSKTVPGLDLAPAPIIFDSSFCLQEGGIQAYQILVERISAITRLDENTGNFETAVVMVDNVQPSQLSAVAQGGTWNHLVAMLILTFPEIRWVFGAFLEDQSEYSNEYGKTVHLPFPKEYHNLPSLLIKPEYAPLLDPTGLREWVKIKTDEALAKLARESGSQEYHLPQRRKLAATIDEEIEYAFMHAYAAYRYGFRADIITSWSLMKDRFGYKETGPHPYCLLIEDMRLSFPDKPASVHLSLLEKRAVFCPLLEKVRDKSLWRFLVTTGQMGVDKDLVDKNTAYLNQKNIGLGKVLYKPMGGIADLWKEMGLYEDLSEGSRPGNAPGFIWPPSFSEDAIYDGHASPGKLMLIAATLLHRAGAIQKNDISVLDCIRGAVLAVDAAELLGGKTPTLTLTAISLKNEFEVKAECAFMGVGYHFSLERRRDELDAEVSSVTRWFHKKVRKRSTLSAKASVLNRMVLAFREAGRMEEEQASLTFLRSTNRKISAPKNADPLAWLSHGLLSYGEWLLGHFRRLILLTVFWVAVFVGGACWLSINALGAPIETTSNVITWFFGEANVTEKTLGLHILSWFGVAMGAFHIGVLISYLYSLISRK